MSVFNYEKDTDGIVTITMDMTGPVNSMNDEFLPALSAAVERLTQESDLMGVIFASAKKTFFANPSQYKYLLFRSHYIKLKPPGIPSILYILHGANQNLGSEKSMQLSHGVMLH